MTPQAITPARLMGDIVLMTGETLLHGLCLTMVPVRGPVRRKQRSPDGAGGG